MQVLTSKNKKEDKKYGTLFVWYLFIYNLVEIAIALALPCPTDGTREIGHRGHRREHATFISCFLFRVLSFAYWDSGFVFHVSCITFCVSRFVIRDSCSLYLCRGSAVVRERAESAGYLEV